MKINLKEKKNRFEIIIETTLGLININQIALSVKEMNLCISAQLILLPL